MDAAGERALGIMGRQVLQQRECTRDAEWQLLHVTLLHPASREQVHLKLGLLHIHAPVSRPSSEMAGHIWDAQIMSAVRQGRVSMLSKDICARPPAGPADGLAFAESLSPVAAAAPAQVSFLAEKTGCDAARLRAPFAVHGTERSLLQDEALGSDAGMHLDFACSTILVRPRHLQLLLLQGTGRCAQGGAFCSQRFCMQSLWPGQTSGADVSSSAQHGMAGPHAGGRRREQASDGNQSRTGGHR